MHVGTKYSTLCTVASLPLCEYLRSVSLVCDFSFLSPVLLYLQNGSRSPGRTKQWVVKNWERYSPPQGTAKGILINTERCKNVIIQWNIVCIILTLPTLLLLLFKVLDVYLISVMEDEDAIYSLLSQRSQQHYILKTISPFQLQFKILMNLPFLQSDIQVCDVICGLAADILLVSRLIKYIVHYNMLRWKVESLDLWSWNFPLLRKVWWKAKSGQRLVTEVFKTVL